MLYIIGHPETATQSLSGSGFGGIGSGVKRGTRGIHGDQFSCFCTVHSVHKEGTSSYRDMGGVLAFCTLLDLSQVSPPFLVLKEHH